MQEPAPEKAESSRGRSGGVCTNHKGCQVRALGLEEGKSSRERSEPGAGGHTEPRGPLNADANAG